MPCRLLVGTRIRLGLCKAGKEVEEAKGTGESQENVRVLLVSLAKAARLITCNTFFAPGGGGE